jgi:hypothetical protein
MSVRRETKQQKYMNHYSEHCFETLLLINKMCLLVFGNDKFQNKIT